MVGKQNIGTLLQKERMFFLLIKANGRLMWFIGLFYDKNKIKMKQLILHDERSGGGRY